MHFSWGLSFLALTIFSSHKIRSVKQWNFESYFLMHFWWKFLLFYKVEIFQDENNFILVLDFLSRSEKGSLWLFYSFRWTTFHWLETFTIFFASHTFLLQPLLRAPIALWKIMDNEGCVFSSHNWYMFLWLSWVPFHSSAKTFFTFSSYPVCVSKVFINVSLQCEEVEGF